MADSPSITIITQALAQVEEVLAKNEQSTQLLNNNLQQLMAQKIGLSHNKQMLTELKVRITKAEADAIKASVPDIANTPEESMPR